MEDDRRVKPLQNSEVRAHAKRLRAFFGLEDAPWIDVIACLRVGRIWTLRGELPLSFQIRPDAELVGADARTTSHQGGILIEATQSVFDKATVGEGRARNTLAHELGHAVLHVGVEMPRLAKGNVTPRWMQPFESSEHQVKVFAPAFLIHDQLAETLRDASEIAIQFGISLQSAEIFYEGLLDRREREHTAQKIRAFAEELGRSAAPSESKMSYLSAPCQKCGSLTVFPVGHRLMCQTCNDISDRLQDGDPGFEG